MAQITKVGSVSVFQRGYYFKEYYGMNIIQQSISRRLSTRVIKVHPLTFLWPGNCSMCNFESTDERFFLDFTAYFQI